MVRKGAEPQRLPARPGGCYLQEHMTCAVAPLRLRKIGDVTTPFDEDQRLRTLRSYDVLDTDAEPAFDRLAQAAARVCEASMATISLLDADRQWFKARVGVAPRETPREQSFCAHAMVREEVFVVCDTLLDDTFRNNELVTGAPFIRFYAGAAVRAVDGAPLGALCVIDTAPRPQGLTPLQAQMLRVLAEQVEPQLRLREAMRERTFTAMRQQTAALASLQQEARLLTALETADVGWWDWDLTIDKMVSNAELARLLGIDPQVAAEGVSGRDFLSVVYLQDRDGLEDAVAEARRTGEPFREDYRIVRPNGDVCWLAARGRSLNGPDGAPARFPGVAIDITDRKLTEERLREADLGRELALDAARLGRFDHDPVRGRRFYDERALDMLGLTLDEAQDVDNVFAHLHPEDRTRVMAAQTAAANPERRGLYREVYRVLNPKTGEERWISGVGRTQFRNGVCTRFLGVLEDVTEAKTAEAHRMLLIHELNHRVKNTLALVFSLVDSSLRNATDVAAARIDIAGRIQALSRAHDLLTRQSWSTASTIEVVEGVITSLSLPRDRLELKGAAVQLGPKPALQLTLALHELATNALKYGALSNGSGAGTRAWGVDPEAGADVFRFAWLERGGPRVTPPTRRGFGSRLIERATAAEFGGAVELDFAQDGVRWRLNAPYAGLAERGRGETPALHG